MNLSVLQDGSERIHYQNPVVHLRITGKSGCYRQFYNLI